MRVANELARLMGAIIELEDAKGRYYPNEWNPFLHELNSNVETAEKEYLAALKKALGSES